MKESWNFGNSQCYSFFYGSYSDTYSTSLYQSICSTWITNYFKAYCFPWMSLGGSFPQPDSSTSPQLLRLMLLSTAALVFCIFSAHPHLFIILYYQDIIPGWSTSIVIFRQGDSFCFALLVPCVLRRQYTIFLPHATAAKSTPWALISSLSF